MDKVIKSLERNGFRARFFKRKEEVKEFLIEELKDYTVIGVGGSVTIREVGIIDELKRRGKKVLDHWEEGLSKEEILSIRKAHLSSEVFLTSANAITEDGKIICIDGIGNRVSSMIFGPGRVIVVAGRNKIVKDTHEGIKRVKNVAAPLNAERSGIKDLPCVKEKRCVDCNHPKRMCRITVIIERRPALTDYDVLLVGEDLGF